jgi:hypothetical protein
MQQQQIKTERKQMQNSSISLTLILRIIFERETQVEIFCKRKNICNIFLYY